jgi:tRNA-modifying protein YgfZ
MRWPSSEAHVAHGVTPDSLDSVRGDNGGMELSELVYADRSGRGKLRVAGEQRLWFLHQVLTQAFEDMAPGDAREAAMLTTHGRMTAYVEALATDDAVLCHFEPELRADLPDALRGYLFATRAEVEDVTDGMALVLVAGPDWRGAAEKASAGGLIHPTRSLGAPAGYVWDSRDRAGEICSALERDGARRADEDELEGVRIANGVPRWGRDMDARTFPQEATVDDIAVHYDKGCYLGQEAMAKIHFRGKVNRKLRRLEATEPLEVGSEVMTDGRKVGVVTSAHDGSALAMVRHTLDVGQEVMAGATRARVAG